MEKKKISLWIGKALLFASIFTVLVLLFTALLMYKADVSMDTAGNILMLAYIGAPFLVRFTWGKRLGKSGIFGDYLSVYVIFCCFWH